MVMNDQFLQATEGPSQHAEHNELRNLQCQSLLHVRSLKISKYKLLLTAVPAVTHPRGFGSVHRGMPTRRGSELRGRGPL